MKETNNNVIHFNPDYCGDVPVKAMFEGILKHNDPEHAFVIAWDKEGHKPTYHSSTSDVPIVLLRLQEFIHKYYNGDFVCD